MPIFEYLCAAGHRTERYLSKHDSPDPDCGECGSSAKRVISRFAAIWTKPISEYGDPKRETYQKDIRNEGHWVARKRSGGGTDEKPLWERLTSVQQQRAYCREEGLMDPSEVGQVEVKADGMSCTNQAGMPGAW